MSKCYFCAYANLSGIKLLKYEILTCKGVNGKQQGKDEGSKRRECEKWGNK